MDSKTVLSVIRDRTGEALGADDLLSALNVFIVGLGDYIPCDTIGVFAASSSPPVIVNTLYKPVAPEYLSDFSSKILAKDLEATGHELTGRIAIVTHGTPCDPNGPSTVEHITLVPLEMEAELLGWLAAAGQEALTEDQEEALYQVAFFLPLIIRAFRRIEQVSSHDPLTGLFNRQRIEEELEQILSEASRIGQRVSILIADIIGFKDFNEKYGHLAGDEVLKEFARRMREYEREFPVMGRLGDDEFVAILPGKGKDKAEELADRLSTDVLRHSFKFGDESVRLRISVGVVCLLRGRGAGAASNLLAKADKALFEAQRHGGKRTVTIEM